jgi:hypothetical protein
MPSDFTFASVGLMSGEALAVPTTRRQQILEYSEVATSETPLPIGLRPVSLLAPRTGILSVGERIVGRTSEPERLVSGSLAYVQAIASALPIDEQDERIVDGLMAKRAAGLSTRPLRRRQGESG